MGRHSCQAMRCGTPLDQIPLSQAVIVLLVRPIEARSRHIENTFRSQVLLSDGGLADLSERESRTLEFVQIFKNISFFAE